MRKRWADSFCLPRYTPAGWWECDVFQLTDALWWTEFEIKLSVSDYRADALKEKERGPYVYGVERQKERKHDLLAAHDPQGPNRFYYVTPVGLLEKEVLPAWAGWIEVHEAESWSGKTSLYERTRVKAPVLHRQKRKEDPNHVRGTCYWRYHRLRKDGSFVESAENPSDFSKSGENA